MANITLFGRVLAPVPHVLDGPDWRQADPRWIERALAVTQQRPHGGWFVLDASRRITSAPRKFLVHGHEFVVFRDKDGVIAGPDACPHMGGALSDGRVVNGEVLCPWHALACGRKARGRWRPVPTFDDGVLVWLRLDDTTDAPTDKPFLPERPSLYLEGVLRMEARCAPADVVANRLDPWHGVHFHPHSFKTLFVTHKGTDDITVRVAYGVVGKLAVEVDARFHSPEPNSIVMTIVDGEGTGSLVETHATPVDKDRTAIIEATIATSERPGFKWAVRYMANMIRPMVEARARRLWVEDAAYAERRAELRRLGQEDSLPT